VPFDPDRLAVTGPPATMLDGIMVGFGGPARFAVANNGSIAYLRGKYVGENGRFVWADRQGRSEPLTDDARVIGAGPRVSPDGQRVAFEVEAVNDQIWIYDIVHRTLSRLTDAWNNSAPKWTRDGKRITFWSDRSGVYNIYWQPADGSGPAERLAESPRKQAPGSWSPDGKTLAFTQVAPSGRYEIWLLTLGPERRVRPLIQTPYFNHYPAISPDGRWLAYDSNETGRWEIYVQPFPGLGAKWQVSNDGGVEPRWEPKHGRELYYTNGDKVMAVSIRTAATFAADPPRLLFSGPYMDVDVAADGRFIMVERPKSEPTAQITLVQNWFDELKRKFRAQ
jgi:Tol biopolymer transport system component